MESASLPAARRELNPATKLVAALAAAALGLASPAWGAGLIVLATEGPHGLVDLLRGSCTERVVDRAGCPVLSVPV